MKGWCWFICSSCVRRSAFHRCFALCFVRARLFGCRSVPCTNCYGRSCVRQYSCLCRSFRSCFLNRLSMAPRQVVPLSELTLASKRVTICVRISRMWNYFKKQGELGHLDLVLIDEMGTAMYAEIAGCQAPRFKDLLVEGEVYVIWDFFVQSAKNMFRPVEGKFMIKTTPWTKVEQKTVVPANFPRYAYSLTAFDVLPGLIGKKESFVDALDIIVGISDLLVVRLPGQMHESQKRNLRVVDIDGKTIDVALWGQHGVSFDGKELYKKAQSEVLIILLVGTLMKDHRGHETISCGDAAKYYINPDIPEVAAYCDSLGKQLPVVEWMSAADDRYQKTYKQRETRPVDIETLLSTDPNDFIGQNLVCTVTLTRVKSPSWWFLACSRCHKTAYSAATEFTCSDPACPSKSAEPSCTQTRCYSCGNICTCDIEIHIER